MRRDRFARCDVLSRQWAARRQKSRVQTRGHGYDQSSKPWSDNGAAFGRWEAAAERAAGVPFSVNRRRHLPDRALYGSHGYWRLRDKVGETCGVWTKTRGDHRACTSFPGCFSRILTTRCIVESSQRLTGFWSCNRDIDTPDDSSGWLSEAESTSYRDNITRC